jgi:hypothetical protein
MVPPASVTGECTEAGERGEPSTLAEAAREAHGRRLGTTSSGGLQGGNPETTGQEGARGMDSLGPTGYSSPS